MISKKNLINNPNTERSLKSWKLLTLDGFFSFAQELYAHYWHFSYCDCVNGMKWEVNSFIFSQAVLSPWGPQRIVYVAVSTGVPPVWHTPTSGHLVTHATARMLHEHCLVDSFSPSGSHIENWHSIMRIGLINASGTKHQMHGTAYGNGIYLSPQASVSFGYSGMGYGHYKSQKGNKVVSPVYLLFFLSKRYI